MFGQDLGVIGLIWAYVGRGLLALPECKIHFCVLKLASIDPLLVTTLFLIIQQVC